MAGDNLKRKGIILAGGTGSRLFPATLATSKQLLPVYDRPLVYFPLCTLLQLQIREILIITSNEHLASFRTLLGDGKQWGVSIEYAVQDKPKGLVEAFTIGKSFIAESPVALILGDNLFHGPSLSSTLSKLAGSENPATIFGFKVDDPERFGVVELTSSGKVISVEEKPSKPRSPFAIPGLYLFDNSVVDFAPKVTPSARGELEITDLINQYLTRGTLRAETLPEDVQWFDAGTSDSLFRASLFVKTMQEKKGVLVGSPEETSWKMGFIDDAQLEKSARKMSNSEYGKYLQSLLKKRTIPFAKKRTG